LVQKPQTKYKIYTNFVNSIPEAYFYYRSNKTLEFKYYDFYTKKELINPDESYTTHNGYKIIPKRDIVVKCSIYDSNDDNKMVNLVPIKYYKYTVGEVDPNDATKINNIIYQSEPLYDGKYSYNVKGLDNCYMIKDGFSDNTSFKNNSTLYRV
jgi:hypothetical protein